MTMVQSNEIEAEPITSVLIVSHNSAASLRRCLTSIEGSIPRQQVEVIVVDNGSTDASPHLDTEFPNATFLRLPRYFGFTKAANIGARTAKGDYLLFLSPAAEIEPDTISRLASYLASDPDAVAVCPLLVDESGQTASSPRALPDCDSIASAWRSGRASFAPMPIDLSATAVAVDYPQLEALLVRKQFVRGMNYLDERYGESWSDAELCYRIRSAGRTILLLPQVRVVLHPDNRQAPGNEAEVSADSAVGASVFISKRKGFLAGLKFRLGAALYSLGQAFLLKDPGFQFSRLSKILSGQKIDGSH